MHQINSSNTDIEKLILIELEKLQANNQYLEQLQRQTKNQQETIEQLKNLIHTNFDLTQNKIEQTIGNQNDLKTYFQSQQLTNSENEQDYKKSEQRISKVEQHIAQLNHTIQNDVVTQTTSINRLEVNLNQIQKTATHLDDKIEKLELVLLNNQIKHRRFVCLIGALAIIISCIISQLLV